MKKLCIIHIALLSAVCLAAPTANEDFVIAEDARTYTNAVQAAKEYTDTATNVLLRSIALVTTNDVCAIVTNETASFSTWTLSTNGTDFATGVIFDYIDEYNGWEMREIRFGDNQVCYFDESIVWSSKDATTFTTEGNIGEIGQATEDMWWGTITATRKRFDRNALGLARLVDLPGLTNGLVLTESDPTVHSWAKSATKPAYTSDEVGAYAAGAGTNLAGVVNLWETYWDGDEVRVTVTNYDSSVHLPSLYLEQKIENTNAYRVVWSESTRWASNALEMAELRSAVDEKADRAWGFYDSHTGEYAPDGYTWLSSPKIAIAGGLAYQRTLTTDGAVWVLVSNGMVAETGGEVTNGFFRIKDDEGNTTFEIVRGNRRTVGATAAGIRVTRSGSSNVVTVPYNVVSEEHPTVYGTTNLSSGEWAELAATWLGQSGAWTAQVSSASATLFIKGEYETGGETYIKNVAPISAESGIYCTDKIHKVRPVYNNGTITWELAQ